MKLFRKCLAVFILALFALVYIALTVHEARADEYQPVKTGLVAIGFVWAPLFLMNDELTYTHAIELEGWSSSATFIGDEIFTKDLRWLSPVIVETFCVLWRTGEMGGKGDGLAWRKLGADTLGVLGTTLIKLDF